MSKDAEVDRLIAEWTAHRASEAEPRRYLTLARDLYNVRNDQGSYPDNLKSNDQQVLASVEHYFLCRAWVGNGVYPAWQIANMVALYDLGKIAGLTPRHNKSKPVTPISLMQVKYQNRGMNDGLRDLKTFGVDAPILPKMPTAYW